MRVGLIRGRMQEVSIDRIRPSESVRLSPPSAVEIRALASDIVNNDLKEPIVIQDDGFGRYVVIDGNRRLAAFIRLGRQLITCEVFPVSCQIVTL